jgi:hypothetical protein
MFDTHSKSSSVRRRLAGQTEVERSERGGGFAINCKTTARGEANGIGSVHEGRA